MLGLSSVGAIYSQRKEENEQSGGEDRLLWAVGELPAAEAALLFDGTSRMACARVARKEDAMKGRGGVKNGQSGTCLVKGILYTLNRVSLAEY